MNEAPAPAQGGAVGPFVLWDLGTGNAIGEYATTRELFDVIAGILRTCRTSEAAEAALSDLGVTDEGQDPAVAWPPHEVARRFLADGRRISLAL